MNMQPVQIGDWFEELVLRYVGGERVRDKKHDTVSNNHALLQTKGANFRESFPNWHWRISPGPYDRLILVGRKPNGECFFFDLPFPIRWRYDGTWLRFGRRDLYCNPKRNTPWWLWRYFPPFEPEDLTWRYYFCD